MGKAFGWLTLEYLFDFFENLFDVGHDDLLVGFDFFDVVADEFNILFVVGLNLNDLFLVGFYLFRNDAGGVVHTNKANDGGDDQCCGNTTEPLDEIRFLVTHG